MVGLVGIEPTTNWLWANCSNPWATGLYKIGKKMAEGMGFEPTEPGKGFTPLAGEPVQPLWHPSNFFFKKNGGETGIRTLGALMDTTVFKTVAFDHSAISPQYIYVKDFS